MSQADLSGIKTQIKSIFDVANTTTASPALSLSMSRKVQKVMKVNPLRFPIQASFYPLVSVYIDEKTPKDDSIARSQTTGRRKGQVEVKIVGAVWNGNWANPDSVDEGDEDCEHLMENIEEILRANTQLASLCSWSKPTKVTYHNVPMGASAHMRAGMLNLEVTLWY